MYLLAITVIFINVTLGILLLAIPSYMARKIPCSKLEAIYQVTYGDLFWHKFVRDPIGHLLILALTGLISLIVCVITVWGLNWEVFQKYSDFAIPGYLLYYLSLMSYIMVDLYQGYLRYKKGKNR
jgi:hypothetical protein